MEKMIETHLKSELHDYKGQCRDLGVDDSMILKCIFREMGCKCVDWIYLIVVMVYF
jgi:hypothetical protein